MHTSPRFVYPVLHVHVAEVLAPTLAEYKPTGHSEHEADPVMSLYFPATQAEHSPPSGPVYPVTHVHVAEVLAATVDE